MTDSQHLMAVSAVAHGIRLYSRQLNFCLYLPPIFGFLFRELLPPNFWLPLPHILRSLPPNFVLPLPTYCDPYLPIFGFFFREFPGHILRSLLLAYRHVVIDEQRG